MQLSYGSTGEESYHVNRGNPEILWKVCDRISRFQDVRARSLV